MKLMCQTIQLGIIITVLFSGSEPPSQQSTGSNQATSRENAFHRSRNNVADGWPHASRKFSIQEFFEQRLLTALGHPGYRAEAKSTLFARRSLRTGESPLWNKMICTLLQIMEGVRPLASWPFDCLGYGRYYGGQLAGQL